MNDRDASERDTQVAMVRALARTGDARRHQGRHADAARLYRQALELCDVVLGPGAPERLAILRGLVLLADALDFGDTKIGQG